MWEKRTLFCIEVKIFFFAGDNQLKCVIHKSWRLKNSAEISVRGMLVFSALLLHLKFWSVWYLSRSFAARTINQFFLKVLGSYLICFSFRSDRYSGWYMQIIVFFMPSLLPAITGKHFYWHDVPVVRADAAEFPPDWLLSNHEGAKVQCFIGPDRPRTTDHLWKIKKVTNTWAYAIAHSAAFAKALNWN